MTSFNYVSTLKLDFDGPEKEYRKQLKRIKIVLNIIGVIRLKEVKIMQTTKGFHTYLYITSPQFTLLAIDLLALQAMMGSDFKREAFNFIRVISTRQKGELLAEGWNVLFESKWKTVLGQLQGELSREKPRPDLEKLFFFKKGKKKIYKGARTY